MEVNGDCLSVTHIVTTLMLQPSCYTALRDILSDKRYIKIMCYVMLLMVTHQWPWASHLMDTPNLRIYELSWEVVQWWGTTFNHKAYRRQCE